MGLDMYLVGKTSDRTNKELGYWRKHPDLHGFIVNEFGGGIDECQQIDLNEECLKQILSAVEDGDLPHTEGFFFGQSSPKDRETDIPIIENAIFWLQENSDGSVFYQASW
jgi:hypothetical protein